MKLQEKNLSFSNSRHKVKDSYTFIQNSKFSYSIKHHFSSEFLLYSIISSRLHLRSTLRSKFESEIECFFPNKKECKQKIRINFLLNALLTCTHNPCHREEPLWRYWRGRACQKVHRHVSQPGSADGPHPGPVELRILGELLSPSGDVLPVLPQCLCRPFLHPVKVSGKSEDKII